jgi:hypothetical protein
LVVHNNKLSSKSQAVRAVHGLTPVRTTLLPVQALDSAEQLVTGSISFAATAKNSLLDLDAWRLSTCGAGTDSATPTSARACQGLDSFPAMDAADVDSTCDRCAVLHALNQATLSAMLRPS